VREHHAVQVLRMHRQRRPVAQAQVLQPLEQAAIDQQPRLARAQQIFRAGDRPGSAEEGELDAQSRTFRSRSAFVTTDTELIAIAAPAKIGESSSPKAG